MSKNVTQMSLEELRSAWQEAIQHAEHPRRNRQQRAASRKQAKVLGIELAERVLHDQNISESDRTSLARELLSVATAKIEIMQRMGGHIAPYRLSIRHNDSHQAHVL